METHTYKVVRTVKETASSVSVYLDLASGVDFPLQSFRAGQHLVFEIPGIGQRAYALSAFSAKPKTYRITVGHNGTDAAKPPRNAAEWWTFAATGDSIVASAPTGEFCLPRELARRRSPARSNRRGTGGACVPPPPVGVP
jgi:ferredoxin-NADP reductase